MCSKVAGIYIYPRSCQTVHTQIADRGPIVRTRKKGMVELQPPNILMQPPPPPTQVQKQYTTLQPPK